PRFGVVATEVRLDLTRHTLIPVVERQQQKQVQVETRVGVLRHTQYEQPVEAVGRERPSEAEGVVATTVIGRVEGLQAVPWRPCPADVTGAGAEQPRPVDRPLCLCKSSDRHAAQIGDIVTFTITYSNQGGRAINDVVVSDSLTGRLEYVPGSAKS